MIRVSLNEARRRLPALIRQVRNDPGSLVQISVRDEVVAELRAVWPEPEPAPGAAGRALLEVMRKLPKTRGPRRNISARVNEHLYGRRRDPP